MLISIWNVAGIFNGVRIPALGKRGFCPFRKHKRRDKSFAVFTSRGGDILWKCHSCDPPDNIGDAVALYAKLASMDRKAAWHELRERGYEVPGQDDHRSRRQRPDKTPVKRKVVPVQGTPNGAVLPLDMDLWWKWKANDTGLLGSFGAQRGISATTFAAHDVLEIDRTCIGFGYHDPEGGLPCRVKIRPVDRKAYWIEPRSQNGQGCAQSPLYLAHMLTRPVGELGAAVITEGELDALSLKHVGFQNVVSLPDGVGSAARVNVRPLSAGFGMWLVATDDDQDGAAAWSVLRARAYELRAQPVRLKWRRLERTENGEELAHYKDANAALCAGFTRSDFDHCVQRAMKSAGAHVPLR